MEINKEFSEVKLEPPDSANELNLETGIEIPSDYILFRSLIGGIRLKGEYPYLVINPMYSNKALAEFSHFYDYENIYYHQKRILDHPEYVEYTHEKEKSILLIGVCEEQVEIFIGYGKDNLNKVFIYIIEEDMLKEIGDLEFFINEYLVEYSEELI